MPIDTERLEHNKLTQIHGQVIWDFSRSKVDIYSELGQVPANYVSEVLADKSQPKKITAAWRFLKDSNELELSDFHIDGEPREHSIKLAIRPAGQVRINLGNEQYNTEYKNQ